MMKKNSPKLLALFFAGYFLVPIQAFGFGDGLNEDEKRKMFLELKRINIRLTEIETDNLKNLKESQSLVLMQLQEIQKVIPQLQNLMEQNRADLEKRVGELSRSVQQVLAQAKDDRDQGKAQWATLQQEVKAQMDSVRQGITQDIENVAKRNKELLDALQAGNKTAMEKVSAALGEQTTRLNETQTLLKTELIPAIARENEKSLAKTQSVIEILQKSLTQQKTTSENFQGQLTALNENEKKANEGVKVLGAKVGDLAVSVTNLHASVAKVEEQNKGNAERLMEKNQQAFQSISTVVGETMTKVSKNQEVVGQTGEKLVKIIEILQTQAAQANSLEAKLADSTQKIQENRQNMDLANEKLAKLIEILKTMVTSQAKMEQSLQQGDSGGLKSMQDKIEQIAKEQGGLNEAMADLRKKANVNISRNDDIKKSQDEIKKALGRLTESRKSAGKQ